LPFVLVRSVVATFLARGDTATPVKAALTGVAVNVAFKALFFYTTSLAQVGLALATTIGAWLNLGLVVWLAIRAGHFAIGPRLRDAVLRLAAAGVVLALALAISQAPVAALLRSWPRWREEAALVAMVGIGALAYGGVVLALFGARWLAAWRRIRA